MDSLSLPSGRKKTVAVMKDGTYVREEVSVFLNDFIRSMENEVPAAIQIILKIA